MRFRSTALVAALVVAGCTYPPKPRPLPDPLELMLEDHQEYRAALRREQRRVDLENLGPRVVEFPEHGRVIVRDWRLLGLRGQEYVRFWFTYDNSTMRTVDRARVTFTLRDRRGRPVASEYLDLSIPWFDFAPGNTYTTEIRVPTRGVHHEPGWSWQVMCATHERLRFEAPVAVASEVEFAR